MTTWLAMLRGINVSGRRIVSMQRLRELFESMEFSDVRTYIQSGNVLFQAPVDDATTLAQAIEEQIGKELGVDTRAVLRTSTQLSDIVNAVPFAEQANVKSKVHVTFLAAVPNFTMAAQLEASQFLPDRFAFGKREIYLDCPNGYGETRLNNAFWERRLKVVATTRSYKTVATLLEMVDPWSVPTNDN